MNKVKYILDALDRGLKPEISIPTGPDTWAYTALDKYELKKLLSELLPETEIPCEITLCYIWFTSAEW